MAKVLRCKARFLNLSTLIKGRGYNSNTLEAILPHSRATCQRKLADPKQFTLEDLVLIAKSRKVSISEIAEALVKDTTT